MAISGVIQKQSEVQRKMIIKRKMQTMMLAAAVASLTALAYAHESGPQSYPLNASQNVITYTTINRCARGQTFTRTALRDQARNHCRSTHDTGANALRNSRYIKGQCDKVKTANGNTTITISGARFVAQCR